MASDATLQLLEFAELGRLRMPASPAGTRSTPLRIVVASSLGLGMGITLATLAATASDIAGIALGSAIITAALAVLVPSLDRHREQHDSAGGVRVGHATYRSVDALQRGHWISHNGAWARIDQAGITGDGGRAALLSSGEIIDLREPVLVAAGRFEPEPQEHVAP